MNSEEEYPQHVQSAKFLRLGLDIENELWPRDPNIYTPSTKFSSRVRQMEGALTLDDINGTIKYGELYPAARGCSAFTRIIRGVSIYIIVSSDLKEQQELRARPSKDEFPDLQIKDFNYRAVSLWPFVLNREEAWSMGWPPRVLDRIEELADKGAY